ncbi:MAG: hypothetical protein Q8N99_04675 [Nanoarchaeota archaeon]|nr:hypothetical protein [Nanoarchaeota archaeon]
MEKKGNEVINSIISEKRLWNLSNVFIAVIIGIVIVFAFFLILYIFNINILYRVMLACFFIVVYAIVLFFLLEPSLLREVSHITIQKVNNPLVREVIIEKPVQVVHEVEKRIYYTNMPKKKLNIPKYDYIGSSLTKIYHKKSCRLGKSIKKKYKVQNSDVNFYIKNDYNPCKFCIEHKVKV